MLQVEDLVKVGNEGVMARLALSKEEGTEVLDRMGADDEVMRAGDIVWKV